MNSKSNKIKILAVIPARGGSKGVRKKNIRLLGGLPLLVYTLKTAEKLNDILTKVVVSTENKEIAEIARSYGSEVVNRPLTLAKDDTKSEPVLAHCLEFLENEGNCYDAVLLLSPTNPFRDPKFIREAVNLFSRKKFDAVIGLKPVYKYSYDIKNSGEAKPLYKKRENRQSRKPIYIENGALYLSDAKLIRQGKIFGSKTGYVMMDELSSVNIDEPIDFLYAESIIKSGLFKL
jgi:CMP-N-acetylneuraminic acid synthetase